MGKNKKILIYAVSFILAVSIGICGIAGGIYCGFLYEGSAQIAMSESNEQEGISTFDKVREKIINEIDYSAVPYGMDRLVFERILTKDIIRKDISGYVNSRYYGGDFEPDYREMEKSYFAVTGYIYNEKGITLTPQQDAQLQEYFSSFWDYYKYAAVFEGTKIFAELKGTYGKSLLTIMYISAAVSAVLILALIFIAKDRLSMLAYSFIAGGVMIAAVPLYLLATKGYLRVWAHSQTVYDFYITMIRNGLINIVAVGGLVATVGVVCALAYYFKAHQMQA